jgi:hypothetical protein
MTPEEYQAKVIRAIEAELNELQLRYDTKMLAAIMMARSVYLMRLLVTAGKWRPEDVQVIAMEALADLHEPTEQKPRIVERNNPDPLA